MGKFGKARDAKVFGNNQYFLPGNYKVKIKDTKLVDSAASPGKEFCVIETEVLESSNPEIAVGSERSQVIPLGEQMSLTNVKAFVSAASGVDPHDTDSGPKVEAFWAEVFGTSEYPKQYENFFEYICETIFSQNPIAGSEMDLECVEIITKKNQKQFTKHNWAARKVA